MRVQMIDWNGNGVIAVTPMAGTIPSPFAQSIRRVESILNVFAVITLGADMTLAQYVPCMEANMGGCRKPKK
jgi:hypothetical protein